MERLSRPAWCLGGHYSKETILRQLSKWVAALIGLAVLSGFQPVRADVTADALLKVLVRKGVLTDEEAAAVKAEAAKETAARPVEKDASAVLQAAVAKLQKTTVSGYVQARVTSAKFAQPSTQLMDRRARVTIKNTSDYGKLTIALEGAPTAVSLYDAYYDRLLTQPKGKTAGLTLRVGQFVKPFGLEMETSPADLESPELPCGWGVFFPGYRDVGASASVGVDPNTLIDLAVLNGNGAGSINLTNRDNDNYKDLLARIRYTLPNVGQFAVSGYRGENTVAGTPNITGNRNRWGVAGVFPNVVGGQLRLEYIEAQDLTTNLGTGAKLGQADAMAWAATYVYPLSAKNKVAVRYDEFDPDTHDTYRLDNDGEVKTIGVVGMHQVTDQFKLSLALEHPRAHRWNATTKTAPARNEDVLTLQGQYKF